jgi:hypothetical protein
MADFLVMVDEQNRSVIKQPASGFCVTMLVMAATNPLFHFCIKICAQYQDYILRVSPVTHFANTCLGQSLHFLYAIFRAIIQKGCQTSPCS